MPYPDQADPTRLWVAPVLDDRRGALPRATAPTSGTVTAPTSGTATAATRPLDGQASGESDDDVHAEPARVEEPWLLITETILTPDGGSWVDGLHREHELIWAAAGSLTVETDDQLWTVPPGLGIWIPALTRHHVRAAPGTLTHVTYLAPERVDPPWGSGIAGITLSRAVHELVLHNKSSTLDDDVRLRLQQVVVDLLVPVESASLDITMPTDLRLRSVADAIVADPADDRTLTEWAGTLNISSRTLSRGFVRETGVTLTRWRILVRMRQALLEISSGRSVAAVAHRLGYANPSTFTDLFRQTLGHTPAAYLRSLDAKSR